MRKEISAEDGSRLDRFRYALRSGTTNLHPEFIQRVGNCGMKMLAERMREMGEDVQVIEMDAPPGYPPGRVAVYFLPDVGFQALIGDSEGAE